VTQDNEHLRWLSVFHYIVAGLIALIGCFPIVHVIVGLVVVLSPESLKDNRGEIPPAFFGWMFVFAGAVAMTFTWTFAAFVFVTGQFLARRKHYMFCLVMAGLECCCSPFGTVLGVFTIVVLMRDSVKQQFDANVSPDQAIHISGGSIV
jgi:hypothetical protein